MENHQTSGKAALSVKEFCTSAGISPQTFYRQLASGNIRAKKLGSRTLVPVTELSDWLNRLPNAAAL